MDIGDVKKLLQLLKAQPVEGKVVEAAKMRAANDPAAFTSFKAAESVNKAVVKHQGVLSENAPVRVAHPFNEKEVFQFPPGTDEDSAKKMVREILLKRAREGEEKIELPSKLPDERIAELEKQNKKIDDLEKKVIDLESRKNTPPN